MLAVSIGPSLTDIALLRRAAPFRFGSINMALLTEGEEQYESITSHRG